MRRREFITLVGGAAAWPLAARAQQTGKVWRIGQSRSVFFELYAGFQQGIRELGYVEGKNFVGEFRFAEGQYARLPSLASELVGSNVDILFTAVTAAVRPLQQATRTIPIVFTSINDPVGNGFVASLAQPGGNTTGLAGSTDDTAPKQLDLLVAIVPNVSHIGLLGNPDNPSYAPTPSEIAYQRMLAGDPIEATEQAQAFLKGRALVDYYEEILIGALRLAWADSQRGRLDQQQTQRIRDTVSEVVEDLETHKGSKNALSAAEDEGPLAKLQQLEETGDRSLSPQIRRTEGVVLCIPGRGLLDEAVAMPLAQLLRREGLSAEAKEAETLSMSKLFGLEIKDVALICLCYLQHATPAQLNYASRRLRRKAPGVFILAGVFDETGQTPDSDPLQLQDAEFLQGPLSAGVRRISEILSRAETRIETDQTPALAPG
jgi:hypothetical protein